MADSTRQQLTDEYNSHQGEAVRFCGTLGEKESLTFEERLALLEKVTLAQQSKVALMLHELVAATQVVAQLCDAVGEVSTLVLAMDEVADAA